MVYPEDKGIIIPRSFIGSHAEDFIEEMIRLNGETIFQNSIYGKLEPYLVQFIAKELNLPIRNKHDVPKFEEAFPKELLSAPQST